MEGFVNPEFHRVARTFDRITRRAGGGAVAVFHHGEPVVDAWGGARNDDGAPWERDSAALSFSTTKGVVATVAARLVDQGRLDYDAPVATYWPEFAQAGKEDILVRHLLSHTAAMHTVRGLATGRQMLSWRHMTEVLAAAAPKWEPGTRPGYHGITYGWLVGEVIRRITGGTVDEAIGSELREPLGIERGLGLGLPANQMGTYAPLAADGGSSRMDTLFERALNRESLEATADAFFVPDFLEVIAGRSVLQAELPAVNGVFTARSLAAMYSRLIAPGGHPLVSQDTLSRATEIQTTERDAVVKFPMRWRLGYHMAATTRGILDRGFGHFGFGGSGAWADPDSGIAIAYVTNRGGGTPMGDSRLIRLGGAAIASAGRRR